LLPLHLTAPSATAAAAFGWREGWRYGLLGLPLAFCALPLYVLMPNLYAREWGVPLAALGARFAGCPVAGRRDRPAAGALDLDRLFARSLPGGVGQQGPWRPCAWLGVFRCC
jgi:GPH family glycoside/pentoside/hexuronide:cation symporter